MQIVDRVKSVGIEALNDGRDIAQVLPLHHRDDDLHRAGRAAAVDQLAFVGATMLATASFDGSARVWNPARGGSGRAARTSRCRARTPR